MTVRGLDELSELVSEIVESEVPDVGALFGRYLLGFVMDKDGERALELFPTALSVIKSLADDLPRLVQIPSRGDLEQIVQNLLRERDKLKASELKTLAPLNMLVISTSSWLEVTDWTGRAELPPTGTDQRG